MAQYDGSIRINTEIQTKQAQIQLSTLENRIVKTSDKIASLRSKMDALKDTKIPTQEYKEISAQIQKAESEFNKLIEKQEQMQREGKDNGAAWDRLNQKMDEVGNTIRYAKGELQDLVNTGKAFTLGRDTEEYAKLGQQLKYAENDLGILNQKHDALILKQRDASNGYKKLGDSAKKSFSKVDKSLKKTVGLMGTFVSRLKGIALSLLVFNWITKAFNAVVKSIQEGFENLYNSDEKFKNSVDDLKASTTAMKNAFAAAFRPLVETAIPYIQRLIDYITRLLGLFGQFTALITGQKSYTKAIKQTAAATKEAAKEAKGYLSPLDEINQYSTQDSGGSDAGAGGTMFEEVPISQKLLDFFSKIADYAKKLRDIFNQGFWDGLGDWQYRWEIIKDAIASIKESLIDIFTDPAVLASADKWAQSVAYMLGSLVGSLASIGLTLGANLLGGIAKYLDQNKERIKKYLISIFDIWSEVNYLFSDLFQSIAYVFEAFSSEQGKQLTANLIGIFADAFMGINELCIKHMRDMLNIFIQPFVDNKEGFRTALEGFLGVLAEVTGTIKQGIDETFDKLNEVYDAHFKPFFDSVAQGLSDLVGEFMEFWNGKVQPILDQMAADFDELWKTHIQPFINNVIELIGKVVDVLKVLWENVLQPFISWFIQNILPVILPVIQAIWDLIVDFVAFIADVASNIIKVLGGIIDFLLGVFTGDWEKAFGGIRDIVDGILGIISNIIEVFLNTIKNAINIALSTIKGIIEAIISAIKGLVENSINHVKDVVLGGADSMKKSFEKFKEDLHKVWTDTWNSLGGAVKSVIESIKNTIQAFFDWISDKVNSIIDSISSIGRSTRRIRSSVNFSSPLSSSSKLRLSPYASPDFSALTNTSIPKLATGAVIPANKEFLAVLGDQKHGTNIEAPLDTIKQAAEEAVLNVFSKIGMSGGNIGGTPVNLTLQVTLDGQVLGQKMVDWGKLQQMATGKNPYGLGTT